MSRPTLRLIDGLREQADEAAMEADALRADMRAAAARLRLVLLRPIWQESDFAPLGRVLSHEADRLEAQSRGGESAA